MAFLQSIKTWNKVRFNMKRYFILVLLLILVCVVAALLFEGKRSSRLNDGLSRAALRNLTQGCGHKDCILAINNPSFESLENANSWLKDSDVVFGLSIPSSALYEEAGSFEQKSEQRLMGKPEFFIEKAYPKKILAWHQIVNDNFEGSLFSVTYCPVCGVANAFIGKVSDKNATFGVTGLILNSDLVMYDSVESSYWQQASGEPVFGPAVDRQENLSLLPIITTTWGQWKSKHPQTIVLSKETGFDNDYSVVLEDNFVSGLGSYSPDEVTDIRLDPFDIVYGIELRGVYKAYPSTYIESLDYGKEYVDEVGAKEVLLLKNADGQIVFSEKSSGEELEYLYGYWYAWSGIHSETEVF